MAEGNTQTSGISIRLSDDKSFSGISERAEPNIRLRDLQNFSGVYPLEIRREGARQLVSVIIVSALLFIVVASFVMLFLLGFRTNPPLTIDELRTVLEVLLAPVVGIVGAVTGFYFGSGSAMRSETSGSGGDQPT